MIGKPHTLSSFCLSKPFVPQVFMSMKGSTPRLAPPILTQEDVYIALEHNLPPSATTFLAFYSTVLGGITNDPAAFVVPLDDHMVHRGHAGG